MRSTIQGRLVQVRCTLTLHPGRAYVLGFANEMSSLAVLVSGFQGLPTSSMLKKKILTRRLHLAEDIMQKTVDFGWGTRTKGIEDLMAAPDLPSLDG